MTADAWIEVARLSHDDLAVIVRGLDDEGLARTSGSRQWDVAQVLGHLGSQAEIGAATLQAALGRQAPNGPEFNPQVWARWDALGRREKADGFLRHSEELTRQYEQLDAAARESLRIDLGFLPDADVATVLALRVNELALHTWDVRVVDDPAATLLAPATALLIDRFATLIGYIGHADALPSRPLTLAVDTTDPVRSFGLQINDSVQVIDPPDRPGARVALPSETWLRLIAGRLPSDRGSVRLDGPLRLEDLQRVFPGF